MHMLAGDWTVRRTMVDFLTGARHGFEGSAVITADAFTEQGLLRFGTREMPASRRYRLEPGDGVTRILHADGRDFIELAPKAAQSVRHLCGADLYAGRFFFRGPEEWAEVWRVKGLRKNYASFGLFRRRTDASLRWAGLRLLEEHEAMLAALAAGEASGAPVAFDSASFLTRMRAKHAR